MKQQFPFSFFCGNSMGDDLFSETKMRKVELQFLCVEAHIVMIAAIQWGMIFTLCSKIQVHKVELQFFH
jgi:hypothetical protein